MKPVLLSSSDLILASLFQLACIAAAFALSLNISRSLAVAGIRIVVQLLFVGSTLIFVFTHPSPFMTLGVFAVMLAMATVEVGARQRVRLTPLWHFGIGGLAMLVGAFGALLASQITALRGHPWYQPRIIIPTAGLLLGNALNATSLSMNALLGSVAREREAIEARIILGASRFKAMAGVTQQAVRSALIPTMNSMAAAGIITIPGIMSGQILVGMDPLEASKYQIVLMSLNLAGNMIGSVLAAYLTAWRLTDSRGRLRLERLERGRRLVKRGR